MTSNPEIIGNPTNPPPSSSPIHSLKASYRSGEDDLVVDFFSPLLSVASSYKRAAGYFSSGALRSWAGAIPPMLECEGSIQLLISPELNETDRAALAEGVSLTDRELAEDELTTALLESATEVQFGGATGAACAKLLTWLVASDILEIRFAFPLHTGQETLYHEKFGIVTTQTGHSVAFIGSANETLGGHERNLERLMVFRSWQIGEDLRIRDEQAAFARVWDGHPQLRVRKLTIETLQKLKARASKQRPAAPTQSDSEAPNPWRHQDEAMQAFIAARRGILEMATGTGKTRTALGIMDLLRQDHAVESIIIATTGKDLLDQWSAELLGWCADRGWSLLRRDGDHKGGSAYWMAPLRSVLLISWHFLPGVIEQLESGIKSKAILIHDEVHGLAAPKAMQMLEGQHSSFGYTLGLSATPIKDYSDEGNAFLRREVGPVVFRFGLEEAIQRGILVEFDYQALPYELTESDRERLSNVNSMAAARRHAGTPMSKEEIWIERAKVYKTAEEKPERLADYLRLDSSILDRCVIFAETREYAHPIFELLHEHGKSYSQYFAADSPNTLRRFASGELDCLVTCHKLSQGIDIQNLGSIVILSSARAKLETIQRLGRCLRSDPNNQNKRARVLDFCLQEEPSAKHPSADHERSEWLRELSQVQRQTR